ncbi:unnamed protein product [Pylaiella littoralis]
MLSKNKNSQHTRSRTSVRLMEDRSSDTPSTKPVVAAEHEAAGEAGVPLLKKPAFKKPAFKKRVPAAGGSRGGLRNNKRPRPATAAAAADKGQGKGDNSSSSSSEDDVSVVKLDKKAKKGVNKFSTGGGGVGAEARAAAREALAKETMSAGSLFESSRTAVPVSNAGGATHYTEIDTEADRDARAILEKNVRLNEEGATTDKDGLYHGQAGYKNHIKKNEAQIGGNKHTGTQGPIRAPTFLRATCRFDYQPDICKDYKETGFCGFGDSCKFLHDRADYKSGWAMEQEFEAKEKKRKEKEALGEWAEDDDDEEYLVESEDDLPFACVICRQGFRDPIVTNCGHYFCEQCAREQYRTNPRCAACGKQTEGVFNVAKKLTEKLRKKGMVTKKEKAGGAAGGGAIGGREAEGGGDSDYEIREDGVELTEKDVVRRKTGTWATVTEDAPVVDGEGKQGDGEGSA